jgi:hypothetical protein
MRKNNSPVPSVEASAQTEVQTVSEELESICLRLEVISASLPVPAEEALMLVGEKDMDLSTEIRSVIECVLNDSLRPAIRDLVAVAVRSSSRDEEG